MNVIASGTVVVRTMHREFEEIVEVFEEDMQDTDGSTLTVEDAARRQAMRQAPEAVETLAVDVS
jgi:hypothetical protein